MCADRYPARISVSDASAAQAKPVVRTKIDPAQVVTERQLRSAGAKFHYQIEQENVRSKNVSKEVTRHSSLAPALPSSSDESDNEDTSPLRRLFEGLEIRQRSPSPEPPPLPPMAAAAPINISGDGAVFPKRFDGTEDGLDWLGNFELYCRYKGVIKADGTLQCETQIRSLLAVLLADGAKLWFDSVAEGDRDTWAKLRALFVERFAEHKFLKFKHSKEMFTTKQGANEPVLEYIARIQALARKSCDAPNVNVIIHAVMSGVKSYIAGYLAEKAPTTLVDLIKQAGIAESTLGDAEPVSTSQLQQLQDDMKAQFDALSVKLAGAVANVAEETTPRVRFTSTSRSPSAERRSSTRYNRLYNERDQSRRNDYPSTERRSSSRGRDYSQPADNSRDRRDNRWDGGRNQRPDRYHWYRDQRGNTRGQSNRDTRSVERCSNCDGNVHNDFTQCPSYRLRCLGCGKWGHVIKCCRSMGQRRGSNSNVRGKYQRKGDESRGGATPPRQY